MRFSISVVEEESGCALTVRVPWFGIVGLSYPSLTAGSLRGCLFLSTLKTNAVVFFVQGKIRDFPGTLCHEERGQSERKEHRRRNIEKPVLKSLIGITGQSSPGKCKRLFRKRKEFQKKQKLIPWKIAFTYVYRQCHT